jgi:hypothetical protein
LALLLVLCGMVGIASASTASAAQQASSTVKVSAALSAATPYCSAELTPGSTVVKNLRCYSAHSAMIAALPAVTTVLSIDYMNASYGGASYTWTSTSVTSCTYWPEFEEPSMPSGWNDDISSYRDYAGCNYNPHYENINYGGAISDCTPDCSYIGAAMNDRTSSEAWGN